MGALAIAVVYVLFVWWFSTGAILMLVSLALRHDLWLKTGAALLFCLALAGVAASSRVDSIAGAYCVFTCAILLWGAVELSLLAGWITGPRPEPCPAGCETLERVGYALQAIAYHELALITTAGLVFGVTTDAPNQLGWWTFIALLALRQSAKVNLFLGVRTLNDELLPAEVGFLRSYFARKPMNALFPWLATGATATAAGLAIAANLATTGVDELSFALLAVLVALGALEHWFMVLPVSVTDLWRWSVRERSAGEPKSTVSRSLSRPVLSVIPGGAAKYERPAVTTPACSARQRLEEQFRQAYREQQLGRIVAGSGREPTVGVICPVDAINANQAADGRAP
jgi:putative photosynthetic complex assembly protein 2